MVLSKRIVWICGAGLMASMSTGCGAPPNLTPRTDAKQSGFTIGAKASDESRTTLGITRWHSTVEGGARNAFVLDGQDRTGKVKYLSTAYADPKARTVRVQFILPEKGELVLDATGNTVVSNTVPASALPFARAIYRDYQIAHPHDAAPGTAIPSNLTQAAASGIFVVGGSTILSFEPNGFGPATAGAKQSSARFAQVIVPAIAYVLTQFSFNYESESHTTTTTTTTTPDGTTTSTTTQTDSRTSVSVNPVQNAVDNAESSVDNDASSGMGTGDEGAGKDQSNDGNNGSGDTNNDASSSGSGESSPSAGAALPDGNSGGNLDQMGGADGSGVVSGEPGDGTNVGGDDIGGSPATTSGGDDQGTSNDPSNAGGDTGGGDTGGGDTGGGDTGGGDTGGGDTGGGDTGGSAEAAPICRKVAVSKTTKIRACVHY